MGPLTQKEDMAPSVPHCPTRRMLLVVDRSGTGLVHTYPINVENEKINYTEGETIVWGHTYGVRDFGVTVLDNQLYVLGGYNTKDRSCSGRNLRFNPLSTHSNKWEFLCQMNMSRTKLAASSLDGHVYVTGGIKSDGKSTGSCEMYDPEKDRWRKAGMLPAPRKDHAIVSYDHSIYLSGGFQGKSGHRNIWTYEEQQWRETDVDCPQELVSPRERHVMVKVDNTIYFIGGISHEVNIGPDGEAVYHAIYQQRVEAFKPRVMANSRQQKLDLISPWTWDLFRLRVGRFNAGVIAIGSKIYIIGGTNPDEGGSVMDVECYDTEKDRCAICFTLPKGNFHNVACLVLDMPLEVSSGQDRKNQPTVTGTSAVRDSAPRRMTVTDAGTGMVPDNALADSLRVFSGLSRESAAELLAVEAKAGKKWLLW